MAEQERVAAHQPYHLLACLGGLDQQPRVLDQRVGVSDLRLWAGQLAELSHQLRVCHHQVRLGQQLRGAHGQQPLITWPRANERDAAGGLPLCRVGPSRLHG